MAIDLAQASRKLFAEGVRIRDPDYMKRNA